MKKALTILLSLALIMSFGVLSAAAGEQTGVGTGSYDIDATGTYVEGTTGNGVVFCVDVEWTEMSFTYHAKKEPVWDTSTHTYSEEVPAYWEGDATITVTNHSNAKILVTPGYQSEASYEDATVSFDTEALKLPSAEKSTAPGTITVTPEGSLPAGTDGVKIGTITITIAEDTDVTVEEATELCEKADYALTSYGYDPTDSEMISLHSALTQSSTLLEDTLADFEAGNAAQDDLNKAYAYALTSYNNWMKAHGA